MNSRCDITEHVRTYATLIAVSHFAVERLVWWTDAGERTQPRHVLKAVVSVLVR